MFVESTSAWSDVSGFVFCLLCFILLVYYCWRFARESRWLLTGVCFILGQLHALVLAAYTVTFLRI